MSVFNQSSDRFDIANEIRILLFLVIKSQNCTLGSGQNAGMYTATSENTLFTIQNFQIESNYIAERSGYLVSVGVGGYKIGDVKFASPNYILLPRLSWDQRLLEFLQTIKKKNKRLYRRILLAADSLFTSYYNDPNVSEDVRILSQARAFEILCELPEIGQRKFLKEWINKFCSSGNERQLTYWYETRKGQRKSKDQGSLKVIWADKFYTLRNHIIHGDSIKPAEYVFKGVHRHVDIAVLFFILSLKMIINQKFGYKVFRVGIIWKKIDDGFDKYEGFKCDEEDQIRALYNLFQDSE